MSTRNATEELDLAPDSEGWSDVEQEVVEDEQLQCLLCDAISISTANLLTHQRKEHDFDLIQIRDKQALDFYGLVKLVNWIRTVVKEGGKPDLSSRDWADDIYLQPVLDNDALLFNLDDLDKASGSENDPSDAGKTLEELKQQLTSLQSQFDAYREQVSQTLDKRWEDTAATAVPPEQTYDQQYFESYAFNDIHQTMLQDTVRTDAYRDFIYDNKHLFKDKVVMDVGCGTGILSMFCAKAGARKVIAVDNSGIIDKARQITAENGLIEQIIFVKSKVEEIDVLPGGLSHVDIIVSEWMGYCLFYEAMLPSVLVARDRFLKRTADGFDGLIVPSHCSVQLGVLHDPEWTEENVSYWHDVYGFNMDCMLQKALDDVVVRFPPADTLLTSGKDVRIWNLYETKAEDLRFESSFHLDVIKDAEDFDSWCVWFDMGFSPSSPASLSGQELGSIQELKQQKGAVTFTTGPHAQRTHWQTGVCIIDKPDAQSTAIKKGDVLEGTLSYSKGEVLRALGVTIDWKSHDGKRIRQLWKMR